MNGDNTLLDYIDSLGQTAGGVLNALKRPTTVVQQGPAQQKTNIGLIVGIGVAVVGLFVLVALGRK